MKITRPKTKGFMILFLLVTILFVHNDLWAQQLNNNFKKIQIRTMEGLRITYLDERTGSRITSPKYDEGQDFYDGVTTVSTAGKAGAIDTLGQEIIPLVYSKVWLLGDRMFAVSKSGSRFALANDRGILLTQEVYDEFQGFSFGYCGVRKGNKWGYLDRTGKPIGLIDYDQVEPFYNNIGKVGKKSGQENMQFEAVLNAGFINEKGALVFPLKYNYSKSKVSNKIVLALDSWVTNQNGYGISTTTYALADANGKILVPFERKYIFEEIYDKGILVRTSGTSKFGFLGWDGQLLIPANFYKIEFLQNDDLTFIRVYFDGDNYFYLNENYQCIEYKGISCPEN